MKIVEIPKVKSCISARSNPELIIFWQISWWVGKKSTDSGRYLYASDRENKLPIRGKIWWKYNLKIASINFDFGSPVRFTTKNINADNILGILDVYESEGIRWYEVNNLSQDGVFDKVTNTNINDPNAVQGDALSILKIKRTQN